MPFKINDLTGKRFGRLVVVKQAGRSNSRKVLWLCLCDCGNEKVVMADHLRRGNTKSCGCLMEESRIINNTTHGLSNSNTYNVWRAMKSRCTLPSQKSFPDYGGRGICVCDEWMHSFESYYNYVSKLPHFGEDGYSLDRINNERGYEPGNVQYATRKEQANNRRSSKV